MYAVLKDSIYTKNNLYFLHMRLRNTLLVYANKSLFSFLFLFWVSFAYSQISEGGTPPSFLYDDHLKSTAEPLNIPINFSVRDLKQMDEWRYKNALAPLKIAENIPVSLSLMKDGNTKELPGGEKITTLYIKASGALALVSCYSHFYIPEGGKLFLYNAEKTHLIGAFTEKTNPTGDIYSTEFIAGDEFVIEYVHPQNHTEDPRIEISDIGYGYNHMRVKSTGVGTSGKCNVDINCTEGNNWQSEKKSVVQINQKIGRSWYICTGSLVNNTAEDYTPYILTAYHCSTGGGQSTSDSDYKLWQFTFNLEATECKGRVSAISRSLVGCIKVAESPLNGGSDGLLLRLDDEVPNDYNPYYNGWDRTNNAPQRGVSIHHPSADFKKISTFTETATHETYRDSQSTGKKEAFWNVYFVATENGHGITEGGSSGSPLYNESQLVTGTLTGGTSSCTILDGENLYGKLHAHWDVMGSFLDPVGDGTASTLKGLNKGGDYPSPQSLSATIEDGFIQIKWNKPNKGNPKSYILLINNEPIETTALSYAYKATQEGNYSIGVKAVYEKGESYVEWISIFYAELLAPQNLQAELTDNNVHLTWDAPLYEQMIHWGSMKYKTSIGFLDKKTMYFGQKWSESDITPIVGNQIQAVVITGHKGFNYQIIIKQGKKVYTQDVETMSKDEFKTIKLDTPFSISKNEELLISIKTSNTAGTEVFYAISEGKAESGKGNLLSEDGETWYKLDADQNNNNFLIAGIISSAIEKKEKTLSSEQATAALANTATTLKSTKTTYAKEIAALRAKADELPSNSLPSAFPEIIHYKILRNNIELGKVDFSNLSYTDKLPVSGTYDYYVSILYPHMESKPAVIKNITVNTSSLKPSIHPLVFTDYITIQNNELTKRIDIYSADGRLLQTVDGPGNQLSTSELPTGVYFFRLYTHDKKRITIKGLKR